MMISFFLSQMTPVRWTFPFRFLGKVKGCTELIVSYYGASVKWVFEILVILFISSWIMEYFCVNIKTSYKKNQNYVYIYSFNLAFE